MNGHAFPRKPADIAIPHRYGELIEDGALVAVSSSGGKDSQAMTILLSRVVPREQLLVVHAPLGEVEWPGTLAHIENTIPPGVLRQQLRENDPASRSVAWAGRIRIGRLGGGTPGAARETA